MKTQTLLQEVKDAKHLYDYYLDTLDSLYEKDDEYNKFIQQEVKNLINDVIEMRNTHRENCTDYDFFLSNISHYRNNYDAFNYAVETTKNLIKTSKKRHLDSNEKMHFEIDYSFLIMSVINNFKHYTRIIKDRERKNKKKLFSDTPFYFENNLHIPLNV